MQLISRSPVGSSFRSAVLVLLVSAWLVPAATLAANDEKPGEITEASERKKLLGTWKVISTEYQGEGENPRVTTFDRIHFGEKGGVNWIEGSSVPMFFDEYKIDVRANPKRLDLTTREAGFVFQYPDIYEWDGDRLRILSTVGENPAEPKKVDKLRPKRFATTKGNKAEFLLLLERETDRNVMVPKRP